MGLCQERINTEMPDVPGCLLGRGSQKEKSGNLWECALERCSQGTLNVFLSYAPGRKRAANINNK